MTCMPVFTKDRRPSKPVRWETTWVNENLIATGRSRKRKPINEVWIEPDGTYHVITLAIVGEEAAMDGPMIIREFIAQEKKLQDEATLIQAEKEIDEIIKASER